MDLQVIAKSFVKSAPQTDRSFESHDFREMNARLNYLKDTRGVGLFTASPGMGKTFCLQYFASGLNPGLYTAKYFALTTVSVLDFYRMISTSLGLPTLGSKPVLYNMIQDQIWYMYSEQRRPLVLMIDEAQYLSKNLLNELKLLLNREYDSINFFTLILSGEPSLNIILSKSQNEAFRQRITAHYNFKGLSVEEVRDYVALKLKASGGNESIITPDLLETIHHASRGNPRIVDNIMSYALNLCAQLSRERLDKQIIDSAIQAQRLG